MAEIRVALLQTDIIWHAPEKNRKLLDAQIASLQGRADIVVLPEMFSTGFTMAPQQVAEPPNGPTTDWMFEKAQLLNGLIIGSLPVVDGGQYYNRLLAISPQDVEAEYNKRHLFHLAGEHLAYQPGKEWVCFEYRGWRICPQICYDLRFPVWSRNRALGDALYYDLLIYIANWPKTRITHWDTLLAARAIENQAYTIGVNRVGKDAHELEYTGHSVVRDFAGNACLTLGEKPGAELVTLSRDELFAYRKRFPVWKDADSFDLYP